MKALRVSACVLCLAGAQALKLAFLGDSGAELSGTGGFYAKAVFDMIQADGVDLMLHNGDLDYEANPAKWQSFLNTYTAQGIDVLTSSGNHEEASGLGGAWYGAQGYKKRLRAALPSRISRKCSGAYGERYECSYGAHHFVLIGWRQMEKNLSLANPNRESAVSAEFIRAAFAAKPQAKWRWCVWHKPEGLLNPGDVHTDTYGNWDVYEACRAAGAIITTGHSHVYARTKLISRFSASAQTVAGDDNAQSPTVRCGATLSFVVGSSGYKHDRNGSYAGSAWFRKSFSRTDSGVPRAGALICDFGADPAATTAACEYRLAGVGTTVDSFSLSSALCRPSKRPTMAPSTRPTRAPSTRPTKRPTMRP
jgi:hypothetical protein